MSSFLEQIKTQTEILFLNISDQLDTANLEYEYNNLNNSRYIFHYLHSLDKFFIDPTKYVYDETKALGIPENLSVIAEKKAGYEVAEGFVIPREKLHMYFESIKRKIYCYLNEMDDIKLLEKPENYSYTRFELILGQYRHVMWHVGLSSAITFLADGHGTKYTGLVKFAAPEIGNLKTDHEKMV